MGVTYINPYRFAAFSPLDLSPQAWYDASDTSTITASSGSVSQWNDKSGNSRNLTQATASAQPGTGSTTQNGLNVLTFDGNDRLNGSWGLSFNVFTAVACSAASGSTQMLVAFANDRFPLYVNNSNGIAGYIATGGVNSSNTASGFRTAASAMQTASPRVWLNGVLTTAASTGSGSGGTLAIGSSTGFSLSGSIGEIVICTTVPTDDSITALLAYLKAKWGTP